MNNNNVSNHSRREFIASVSSVLGAISFMPQSGSAGIDFKVPVAKMTIKQVIDLILTTIPGAPFKETVDTIKSGDEGQEVKGIVTTMFATVDVIQRTAALGANFIIAHEPTFYNHRDETTWLDNDQVFQFKNDLLKKHGIVVWRFHDYWHSHRPDGVLMGVLTKLALAELLQCRKSENGCFPAIDTGGHYEARKKEFGHPAGKIYW